MRGFGFALLFVVLITLAFFIGIFSQAPELMLSWMCLSPVAWFLLGRYSHGVARGRRVRLVEE